MTGSPRVYAIRKLVELDKQLADRISEFRHKNRYRAENAAIRSLLILALDLIADGEPAPLPSEEAERRLKLMHEGATTVDKYYSKQKLATSLRRREQRMRRLVTEAKRDGV